MPFTRRIVVLACAVAAPSVVTITVLLWIVPVPAPVKFAILASVLGATIAAIVILHDRLSYGLRTMSNVLSALREEDYTVRLRGRGAGDAMAELIAEVNDLGDMLRERRLDSLEAAALVRAIVEQLDSALFAFDHAGRLQLVNAAGERLLGREAAGLHGRTAAELGLEFDEPLPNVVEMRFPGGHGRWSIHHSTFREKGRTHQLLVVSDLSRVLRDEELLAWQRLVRVLGHELNNSLAPIKSIAASLERIVKQEPLPADWRDDAQRGLGVISARAEALTRFTQAYARLARLPQPVFAPVDVGALVLRVAALRFDAPVSIVPGPETQVMADADQLEQVLINLVRNAADASAETGGKVQVTWALRGNALELIVQDEGPGISGSRNLFVPFFTTKPGGTGIGLVLSRRIAEAHNGELSLASRESGGCEARLRLPLGGSR